MQKDNENRMQDMSQLKRDLQKDNENRMREMRAMIEETLTRQAIRDGHSSRVHILDTGERVTLDEANASALSDSPKQSRVQSIRERFAVAMGMRVVFSSKRGAPIHPAARTGAKYITVSRVVNVQPKTAPS